MVVFEEFQATGVRIEIWVVLLLYVCIAGAIFAAFSLVGQPRTGSTITFVDDTHERGLQVLQANILPFNPSLEVPAADFKNWAGGFTSINAAASFASSGGIPITTVVSGGQISKIRLEHIWVEAAMPVWRMIRMVDLPWQSTNKRSLETVMFHNIYWPA
jgi:hypothetical protein